MLADLSADAFHQLIAEVPLLVVLPPELDGFFEELGYTPSNPFDERRAPRLRLRCPALLEVTRTLPSARRETGLAHVLVSDVSRLGFGLLHHEQLWPEERITLWLPSHHLHATVVRCRRRGPSCYEIGAELTGYEGRGEPGLHF
jgi:hypothetical protein